MARENLRELNPIDYMEIKIKRNRIRRQRQLRRRVAIGIATIVIIICSSLGLTSFLSKAAEEPDAYKIKTYSSVMVPYGYELEDLAKEYMDRSYYDSYESYLNEVMFINHLDDTDVQAGYYLIMPVYIEEF
ncbi:MAG: hypothetical protein K6G12_08580 [Lachnospiraceae bacterium]|nr:hypothetical protein [Lachnospiraceae bacterium]